MSHAQPSYSFEGKKFKSLIKDFQNEIIINTDLKAIINKKTFKLVKTWLDKMDTYFKDLKLAQPHNSKQLLVESGKIFGVLNISATKLFVRKKA